MKQLLLVAFIMLVQFAHAQNVNYSKFDSLLKKYVSAKGKVNYKGLKVKKEELGEVVKSFEAIKYSSAWNQNQKLAYWMNAYNIYTIALIIDNYPTKSIKGLYGGSPWDRKFIPNGKSKVSLNYIENEVLRKMGDARIHFGINCASVSCPDILNKAFTPENVNATLDQLAKAFINNKSKNAITGSKAEVSEVFNWFGADFLFKNKSVIEFINKYSVVKIAEGTSLTFMTYNWNLNE